MLYRNENIVTDVTLKIAQDACQSDTRPTLSIITHQDDLCGALQFHTEAVLQVTRDTNPVRDGNSIMTTEIHMFVFTGTIDGKAAKFVFQPSQGGLDKQQYLLAH